MTLRISETEFRLFRDLIEKECGILLADNKAYLVEARLSGLAEECGCSTFGELFLMARSSTRAESLCRRIVDAITTNETFWFRDQYPYRILTERLLPEMNREIAEGRRKQIHIWSAGCSTGQEPYSIAMTALDFFRAMGKDSICHNWVRITASDVSRTSLGAAIDGRYDATSMSRGILPECVERYFAKDKTGWMLDERVKRFVTFRHWNLKDPLFGFGPFDAVFLRNVMIYFSDALKRTLFERVARVLAPSGTLFLGTGETVSGYSTAFDMIDDKGALFYRVKQH